MYSKDSIDSEDHIDASVNTTSNRDNTVDNANKGLIKKKNTIYDIIVKDEEEYEGLKPNTVDNEERKQGNKVRTKISFNDKVFGKLRPQDSITSEKSNKKSTLKMSIDEVYKSSQNQLVTSRTDAKAKVNANPNPAAVKVYTIKSSLKKKTTSTDFKRESNTNETHGKDLKQKNNEIRINSDFNMDDKYGLDLDGGFWDRDFKPKDYRCSSLDQTENNISFLEFKNKMKKSKAKSPRKTVITATTQSNEMSTMLNISKAIKNFFPSRLETEVNSIQNSFLETKKRSVNPAATTKIKEDKKPKIMHSINNSISSNFTNNNFQSDIFQNRLNTDLTFVTGTGTSVSIKNGLSLPDIRKICDNEMNNTFSVKENFEHKIMTKKIYQNREKTPEINKKENVHLKPDNGPKSIYIFGHGNKKGFFMTEDDNLLTKNYTREANLSDEIVYNYREMLKKKCGLNKVRENDPNSDLYQNIKIQKVVHDKTKHKEVLNLLETTEKVGFKLESKLKKIGLK